MGDSPQQEVASPNSRQELLLRSPFYCHFCMDIPHLSFHPVRQTQMSHNVPFLWDGLYQQWQDYTVPSDLVSRCFPYGARHDIYIGVSHIFKKQLRWSSWQNHRKTPLCLQRLMNLDIIIYLHTMAQSLTLFLFTQPAMLCLIEGIWGRHGRTPPWVFKMVPWWVNSQVPRLIGTHWNSNV